MINYPEGSYRNIGSLHSFSISYSEPIIPENIEHPVDTSPIINNQINNQSEQTASKSKITTLEMFSTPA